MGSGYSVEQQKEFETYRLMLEKAIKDKEPFDEFKIVQETFDRKFQAKHP